MVARAETSAQQEGGDRAQGHNPPDSSARPRRSSARSSASAAGTSAHASSSLSSPVSLPQVSVMASSTTNVRFSRSRLPLEVALRAELTTPPALPCPPPVLRRLAAISRPRLRPLRAGRPRCLPRLASTLLFPTLSLATRRDCCLSEKTPALALAPHALAPTHRLSLLLSSPTPPPFPRAPPPQVLRHTALLTGLFYGLFHARTVQSSYEAQQVAAHEHHRADLLEQAKKAFKASKEKVEEAVSKGACPLSPLFLYPHSLCRWSLGDALRGRLPRGFGLGISRVGRRAARAAVQPTRCTAGALATSATGTTGARAPCSPRLRRGASRAARVSGPGGLAFGSCWETEEPSRPAGPQGRHAPRPTKAQTAGRRIGLARAVKADVPAPTSASHFGPPQPSNPPPSPPPPFCPPTDLTTDAPPPLPSPPPPEQAPSRTPKTPSSTSRPSSTGPRASRPRRNRPVFRRSSAREEKEGGSRGENA